MFSGSALVQGFTKSFGMIFASEIGDKTFFIAALMAMKNPRGVVRTLHFCWGSACDTELARTAEASCEAPVRLAQRRRMGSMCQC